MLSTLEHARKLLIGCAVVALISIGHAKAKGFQVLYAFQGGADGSTSYAGLIADSAGNLYGTTSGAGANGCYSCGTVFRLAPDGTEKVLHDFGTYQGDGASPQDGALVMDAGGNLYGTTYDGGASDQGTIFKVTPDGTESVLFSLTTSKSGGYPWGGLLLDKRGNLYGTTSEGPGNNHGTVFKLTTEGRLKVLYMFSGGTDGDDPFAGVIRDKAGNFYGTTEGGGAHSYGTVYKLTPLGVETVLYSFTGGADGCDPRSTLLTDGSGNLYGTTAPGYNQCAGYGAVFKLAPDGTETTLHSFNGNDGGYPYDNLISDSKGNLYGTAQSTVFKIATDGSYRILKSFNCQSDGCDSYGGLILSNGYLYGTTSFGGQYGQGTVFRLLK